VPTSRLSRPAALDHVGTTPAASVRLEPSPWWWFAGGLLLFFAVPFVGSDLLGLQSDLYYVVYFTVAVAWLAAFASTYADRLGELWRHNVRWSLLVGAVAGALLAAVVFGSAATDHPDGWRWWFEIGWRGLVYGTIDALVLFVFPAAVAYLLMRRGRSGARYKIAYAALALVLSLLMSTAYHLGYPEYRDADLRSPLIGTVMANASTVLTGNPLGSIVTHTTAHTAAVVHQRDGGSTQMLPPKVTADYPSHGDPDVAAGLALVWVIGTAGALTVVVRRHRSTAR